MLIDVCTRRIVGFGIEGETIDGPAVCRMFNHVIAGRAPPARISTDHDPLLRFHRWLANLRILEIEEIKSVPYSPTSHPFVERLIGTIRREYLDHTFFWNSIDLERKLDKFQTYYNRARVHRSLDGHTPANRAGDPSSPKASLAHYVWERHCSGLFETPVAARWGIRTPPVRRSIGPIVVPARNSRPVGYPSLIGDNPVVFWPPRYANSVASATRTAACRVCS